MKTTSCYRHDKVGSRRAFLLGTTTAAMSLPLSCGLVGPESRSGGGAVSKTSSPWKMDITLYDRQGWCNHGWYHKLEEDGSLLVPVQSCNMSKPFGDFLRTETDDLVLKSLDGGKSWTTFRDPNLSAYPWGCYGLPGETRDGTLVSVICATYIMTAEERRTHLERHGIQRFYNSRSEWLYTPWPVSMAGELRQRGYHLHDGTFDGAEELVFSLTGFVYRTSNDGGKTWKTRPIEGVPFCSKDAGSFRETLITQKGSWVASVFCSPNPERKPVSSLHYGAYALRSADQGQTWRLNQIAYDPDLEHSFDETSLLELPSGRILAMMRHYGPKDSGDRYLYESHSDDDGVTWSTPAKTEMWGYPAHLLRLKSGKILCTYGHRRDPWGHRAALSADEGKSWEIGQIKLLRDDSLPGWTTYPMSSQLEDGTIFTTCGLLKKTRPGIEPPPDKRIHDGQLDRHTYLAASLYTEDFIQPLGSSSEKST